ncbi:class I SAM-dependent methyltransferase [Ammoniphilus sp. CFH 90114]|nr:class I SAM-dependent methyltransferase [Ammoniphilus sp. CFH 90114]
MLAWFGIGGAHPGGLALTKEVLQRIKIGPETNIIDIGCGTGQTAAYLKKTFQCKVSALDRNKVMLEKAKHDLRKRNLVFFSSIKVLCFSNGKRVNRALKVHTTFTSLTKSIFAYNIFRCASILCITPATGKLIDHLLSGRNDTKLVVSFSYSKNPF